MCARLSTSAFHLQHCLSLWFVCVASHVHQFVGCFACTYECMCACLCVCVCVCVCVLCFLVGFCRRQSPSLLLYMTACKRGPCCWLPSPLLSSAPLSFPLLSSPLPSTSPFTCSSSPLLFSSAPADHTYIHTHVCNRGAFRSYGPWSNADAGSALMAPNRSNRVRLAHLINNYPSIMHGVCLRWAPSVDGTRQGDE